MKYEHLPYSGLKFKIKNNKKNTTYIIVKVDEEEGYLTYASTKFKDDEYYKCGINTFLHEEKIGNIQYLI